MPEVSIMTHLDYEGLLHNVAWILKDYCAKGKNKQTNYIRGEINVKTSFHLVDNVLRRGVLGSD